MYRIWSALEARRKAINARDRNEERQLNALRKDIGDAINEACSYGLAQITRRVSYCNDNIIDSIRDELKALGYRVTILKNSCRSIVSITIRWD